MTSAFDSEVKTTVEFKILGFLTRVYVCVCVCVCVCVNRLFRSALVPTANYLDTAKVSVIRYMIINPCV